MTFFYSISIPYQICSDWCSEAGHSTEKYTLILESFLLDKHSLTLKKDAFRLGERPRRECPVITKKLKSAGGNKRHALLNKNFCLNIRRNELITFADMTETQTKLADVHEQLDLASETILDLETNVLNLHSEIKTLKELIDAQTEDLELEKQKSQNLLETNETLQKYVENICGIPVGVSGMSGRANSKFSKFSRSYQLRRLKEVKSRAECALWFLDMYGLKLDS